MNKDDFVLPFQKLNRKSVALAGGKGAQLGEMFNAGIPVPPGFVVITPSFDWFLNESGLAPKIDALIAKVDEKKTAQVDETSKKIRKMILDAKVPKEVEAEILKQYDAQKLGLVAVRSSATAEDASAASWAGELESYMNVDRKELVKMVKLCWSSLFTPRAIFYRIEKKMRSLNVSVAVVVQKMVNSEVSGVAFTVHPVTKDRNQMVIEAGYGLGESVVAGLISPDNYIIDKSDNTILDVTVNKQEKMITKVNGKTKTVPVPAAKQEQQKLDGKAILKLAQVCRNIEKHYGTPQDIEFAIEAGKTYVVQTRPITTL